MNTSCVYHPDQERTSLASVSEAPLLTIILYLIIPRVYFLAQVVLMYLFIWTLTCWLSASPSHMQTPQAKLLVFIYHYIPNATVYDLYSGYDT